MRLDWMDIRSWLKTRSSRAALVALLCLGSFQAVSAQGMVSVNGRVVNMREGPSTSTPALWRLSSGYPLKVVGKRGSWLKVSDFEGDQGWVSKRLTVKTAHHIVSVSRANLRSGPGSNYRLVGQAVYGDVFRTLEKRKAWVRVQSAQGQKAWIFRKLLWGW